MDCSRQYRVSARCLAHVSSSRLLVGLATANHIAHPKESNRNDITIKKKATPDLCMILPRI